MSVNNLIWNDYDSTIRFNRDESMFRCSCGCNVFRFDSTGVYAKCNGCPTVYETIEKIKEARDE